MLCSTTSYQFLLLIMCFLGMLQASEVREQRLSVFSEQWQQWDTSCCQVFTAASWQIQVLLLLLLLLFYWSFLIFFCKTDSLRYDKHAMGPNVSKLVTPKESLLDHVL